MTGQTYYTNAQGTKTLLPVSAHHHDSIYSGLDHTHPPEGRLPHCSLTSTQAGTNKDAPAGWTSVDIFTSNFVTPDVYGMWNPGNPGVITIPVDGTYLVNATIAIDDNTGTTGAFISRVLVNGTTTRQTGEQGGAVQSSNNLNTILFVAVLQLEAGDELSLEMWHNTPSTVKIYSGAGAHHATTFSVIRLDGYSTAQDFAVGGGGSGGVAGPPFYAHIRRDSDYSFADAGGGKAISWESDLTPTSDEIVPMAWSGSGVTIPKDGVYVVMGRVQMNASGEFDNARIIWGVTVNGSEQGFKEILRGHTTNSIFHVNTTPKFYSAGDVISAAIEVQGTTSGGTVNQADLVVVSQAGAGSEYVNPALAQVGEAYIPAQTLGSGSSATVSVTFPTPFSSPPFVTLKKYLNSGAQWLSMVPHLITETGFTLYAYNINSTSTTTTVSTQVDWRAVGKSDVQAAADSWNTPTLLGNFNNYSGSWSQAGYRKDNDGLVHLRGLIGCSGGFVTGQANPIFVLPPGYRPGGASLNQGLHMLALAGTGSVHQGCNVKVYDTGEVVYDSTEISPSWVSLDGLTFSTNIVDVTPPAPSPTNWATPTFENGWTSYDTTSWGPAQYRRLANGMIIMRGLVKDGPITSTMFTLPVGFRPERTLVFLVGGYNGATTTDGSPMRVNIFTDGRVELAAVYGLSGGAAWPGASEWVSLANITFLAEA